MTESLRKRIVTALVLVVLFLGVLLFLPPFATVIVVTALVLAGAWEWSAFLRPSGTVARVAYVALVALLLLGARHVAADSEGRHFILVTALIWWLVALGWIIFAPRRVASWSAGLAGVLALVPAWVALVWLRYLPNGAYWVLFTLLLVWGADIGAYFAGHRFGHTRLAPNVSPGKNLGGRGRRLRAERRRGGGRKRLVRAAAVCVCAVVSGGGGLLYRRRPDGEPAETLRGR